MESSWYLGVETSTASGSLALVNRQKSSQYFERNWNRAHSHSEVITKLCGELIEEAGIAPKDLSGIVSGCGPGSFTGIRVAINFAKSLAFANQIPIWTINSLEAMAWQASPSDEQIVLVGCEAFRDLIYVAMYKGRGPGQITLFEPQALTSEQIVPLITQPTLTAGSALQNFWDDFKSIHHLLSPTQVEAPTARAMLEATVGQPTPPPSKDWKSAKPLYIRASEAEEKLKIGELKPQKPRF